MKQLTTLTGLAEHVRAVGGNDHLAQLLLTNDAAALSHFTQQFERIANDHFAQCRTSNKGSEMWLTFEAAALQAQALSGLFAAACNIRTFDEVAKLLVRDLEKF